MMKCIVLAFLLLTGISYGQTKYEKDFDEFWDDIHERYAYFEKQGIDWQKVKDIYRPLASKVASNSDFIRLLEDVVNELYNGHNSLNVNLRSSNRLVPSGLDLYVEKVKDKFIITDLRKSFGAELCGLTTGMEIVKYNDLAIEEQLKRFLPKATDKHNGRMYQYALAMLFAGTHDKPRKITVMENGKEKVYFPDSIPPKASAHHLEVALLKPDVVYIKINNALFKNELIEEFDQALDSLLNTKSLVLDLTETPSGGNTTVARAIMGRFIDKMLPYQRHEFDERPFGTKRHWMEYVVPRKQQYKGKLVVMVGHWTGSMGEGMAIGFDGMKRATVIGTEMAGLIGAISNFRTTELKIGFQVPTERLYHINGTPREDYRPTVLTRSYTHTWQEVMKSLKIK